MQWPQAGQSKFKDLVQRMGTAAVLAVAAIALTVAGVWPFAAMAAGGSLLLAREWAGVTRGEGNDRIFYIHASTAVAACILAAHEQFPPAIAVLVVGSSLAAIFGKNSSRIWALLGPAYLGLAAGLLVHIRADMSYGLLSILFLFLVVWLTDIAAYFCGRSMGGPKLAPAISPGKTWSGFAGGLIVPALMAGVFGAWLGGTSPFMLAAIGAAISLASQAGDLIESVIKRRFGVKDFGTLLLGHGGLFDRVDGLIGASFAAGLLALVRGWMEPGKAILIWP
jgi:phosphatidate cytidylyltransferase